MSWQHHSELLVWNKAMDLADEIYRLTRYCRRKNVILCAIKCIVRQYPFHPILRKGMEDIMTMSSSVSC